MRTSLAKLKVSWVDALLLHGPMPTIKDTLAVWKIIETYVPHKACNIGLSNINILHLQAICEQATVLPATIQNRFQPQSSYDRLIREYCGKNGIVYQAFSIIKSNPHLLTGKLIGWLAS